MIYLDEGFIIAKKFHLFQETEYSFREKGGKELLLSKRVHWEANNLSKKLAFSEQFEIILSVTKNGGILDVSWFSTKRSTIFQYVLGSIEGPLSFWLNYIMYFSFATEIIFVH